MARKKVITRRRRAKFLEKLARSGSVVQAAEAGEISRKSFYKLRHRDPEFAEEWDIAERRFLDAVEAEAIRRAVSGVNEDRPYTHVDDKTGLRITRFRTINSRSDKLLERILIARHPLYAQKSALELSGPDGGPVQIDQDADLSVLTEEELTQLVAIRKKMEVET